MATAKSVPVLPQPPPRFTSTPSSITQDAQRLLHTYRSVQDQIVSTVALGDATFDSVIVPLVHAENELMAESAILNFYRYASPDSHLRDASSEAHQLVEDLLTQSRMREDIFHLVDAVFKRTGPETSPSKLLKPESQHLLNCMHRQFVKNGLGLPPGSPRDRFAEIQRRISIVAAQFTSNCSTASTAGVWYHPAELPGLPADILASMEKGTTEDTHDKVFASFRTHQRSVLRFVTNTQSRKKMYVAQANKCDANIPLFKEVVLLRDEAARLLGYPSHAAFALEDKMARTPETVNLLLDDLRTALMSGGRAELEKYKALKREDCEAEGISWDGHYFVWDQPFYSRKLLARAYQVDHQLIAEYFPLETTVAGMLAIFRRLFGLRFSEYPRKASDVSDGLVWHEDVKRLAVWDDEAVGGEFLGFLFLDLYSRDFKGSNASCFSLVPGYIRADGSRHYPTTALLCGFPKPTPATPCLLRHEDVVILFHELGHGIHELVSKTAYARFHGSAGTVVDFGEAPSQMLENWCWDPIRLKALSRHYSTLSPENLQHWREKRSVTATSSDGPATDPPEAQLPDQMLEDLLKSKSVHQALSYLNQLSIAIFDMAIHEPDSREAAEQMNITEVYNRIRREVFPLEAPWSLGEGDEWGCGYAEYRNLIDGDYHAGYYGYILSNIYSADMFDSFFSADPMSVAEGKRYRSELLEKGGSRPEMETLVAYLGRRPSPAALYRELGLA